jgi:hypothetical protein
MFETRTQRIFALLDEQSWRSKSANIQTAKPEIDLSLKAANINDVLN